MQNKNHGKLLEILLIIKGMDKTEFSKLIGKDRNNFPNTFKKEKLGEDLLEDICKVMEIDRGYFDTDLNSMVSNYQSANNNLGSTVSQNIVGNDTNALYERLLKEKDEVIKLLREQLNK